MQDSINKDLPIKDISIKVQMQAKTKRLRDAPSSFAALKSNVEALLAAQPQVPSKPAPFGLQYLDEDDELINLSDDDDLVTAYEIAGKKMDGSLKVVVNMDNKE